MHFIDPDRLSRRAFLRRSAQLAFTGAALPTALNLAAFGEAAAFGAQDYKALVCVFLQGGNDHANTLVTYDSPSYNRYAQIRGDGRTDGTASGIALARSALAPTRLLASQAGREFALHPNMTGLAQLFNQGDAAALLNVGTLVAPLTRQHYNGTDRTNYPLPPKLFSHNDQQSFWQSSGAEGATTGWGGRIGDLVMSNNTQLDALLTCVSVAGNTVLLSGESALSYQVGTGGAVKVRSLTDSRVYGSNAVKLAMQQIAQQPAGAHWMEAAYTDVVRRAVRTEDALSSALRAPEAAADSSNFEPFTASVMDGNSLAAQLKMVARLISARQALGNKRQVFFVSMGGFDMHNNLMASHATLLERLSQALTAFQQTMSRLSVADSVTTFTASDFGRTLTSNGDGSDHGWGSHHFIVGGAVKGKAFYGKAPPVSVGNDAGNPDDQWHVGQGRLLPSTSVDQYAATLAKWFGVSAGEMVDVLPNLSNFGGTGYPTDLGFMQASA